MSNTQLVGRTAPTMSAALEADQLDIVNIAAERGRPASVLRASGWGDCECGHAIYDHGRRVVPNAGYREYVACRKDDCSCVLYLASDGSAWPHGPAGVPR